MKSLPKFLFGTLLLLASNTPAFASAKIDPRLQSFLEGDSKRVARVLVVMNSPLKNQVAPRRYDRNGVIRYLQESSRASTALVARYLRDAAVGADVKVIRPFWINNALLAEVTVPGLKKLANAPGAIKIYLNARMSDEPTFRAKTIRRLGGELPYNFIDTSLDKVMTEMPELTGKGATVGQVDTGVDGAHPALAGKIRLFFNIQTRKVDVPRDTDAHGTHTAGTIVGGNRTDNFIGVAPGAELISAGGSLGRYDDTLAGMEWMLKPSENPNDIPRAVSNSWNCQGAPDVQLFYRAIGAWEAAGILPVFSAGNAGPRPGSITRPHEHPATFAVGSTGPDGLISEFSSRGPGMYNGQKTEKPELTAPGGDIRSSVPNGQYKAMSGTSMATPHVTGAIALLLQVNPKLNPSQLREILVRSATPTAMDGSAGPRGEWNPNYGYGKLNIYEAVKLAKGAFRSLNRKLGFNLTLPSPHESVVDQMLVSRDDLSAYAVASHGESQESFLSSVSFPAELEGRTWIQVND